MVGWACYSVGETVGRMLWLRLRMAWHAGTRDTHPEEGQMKKKAGSVLEDQPSLRWEGHLASRQAKREEEKVQKK